MPNRFCSCGLQRGRSVCVYGCVYVCICVCVCVCLCGAGQVYMCVGRGKGACVRAHVYVYAYVCAYAHLHAGHVGASKLSLCIQLTIQESSSKERHAPCCPLPCPLPAAPCRPCCPLLPPACSGRRAGPMSPLHQQAWQNLNLVVNTAKRLSCAAMHRSPQHMVWSLWLPLACCTRLCTSRSRTLYDPCIRYLPAVRGYAPVNLAHGIIPVVATCLLCAAMHRSIQRVVLCVASKKRAGSEAVVGTTSSSAMMISAPTGHHRWPLITGHHLIFSRGGHHVVQRHDDAGPYRAPQVTTYYRAPPHLFTRWAPRRPAPWWCRHLGACMCRQAAQVTAAMKAARPASWSLWSEWSFHQLSTCPSTDPAG